MVPGAGNLKRLDERWWCNGCHTYIAPFYVLVEGTEVLTCEYCFLNDLPEDAKLGEAEASPLLLPAG